MKKFIGVLLVAIVLSLTGCTNEDDGLNSLEKVEKDGYMILGLDDTFAPLGFRDENGDVVGFDVELARAVAEKLGVELRIQPIEWDSKLLELNTGNIDFIWNGLSITEDRKENINFSEPYLSNRQIVIVKDGLVIDDLTDLTGLKVGVQIDSSGQSALQGNDIYSSIGEMIQFNSFNDALLDLDAGRIDVVVIDEIMARYVVSQSTYSVSVTEVSLGSEEYGIGFRLGDDELRLKIDQILDELAEEGVTAQISIKWFGEDIFKD